MEYYSSSDRRGMQKPLEEKRTRTRVYKEIDYNLNQPSSNAYKNIYSEKPKQSTQYNKYFNNINNHNKEVKNSKGVVVPQFWIDKGKDPELWDPNFKKEMKPNPHSNYKPNTKPFIKKPKKTESEVVQSLKNKIKEKNSKIQNLNFIISMYKEKFGFFDFSEQLKNNEEQNG